MKYEVKRITEELKRLGVNPEWIKDLDFESLDWELPESVVEKLLEMRATLGPWDLAEGLYKIKFTRYEPKHDYTSLEGVAIDQDGNQYQIGQVFWHYSNKNEKFFNNARYIRPMLAQVDDLPAPLVQSGLLGIVACFGKFGCIECQANVITNPELVSDKSNGHEFEFDLNKRPIKKVRKLK